MLSIFIDGVEERDFSNVMDSGNKHTGGIFSEIPKIYGKLTEIYWVEAVNFKAGVTNRLKRFHRIRECTVKVYTRS